MEEYNDPIRNEIEQLILDEIKGAKKLTIGSDERTKSVNNAVNVIKAYHEDCRLGGQLLKDNEEMELNRKKFVEESNRAERRLELEEATKDAQLKWYNLPIVEKAMVCGVSLFTMVSAMKINSGMTPLKNTIEKYIHIIKP